MLKEACVETLEQAVKAQRLGADRIELCSRLDLDGLTPSESLYKKVRAAIELPIHVMIRIAPNADPDDFVLSEEDLGKMERQMTTFQKLKVDGFVLGGLNEHRQVSIDQIKRLEDLVKKEKLVFHKAIDLCEDSVAAALDLEHDTRITHILTSGGSSSAWNGKEVIKLMQQRLKRVQIIAAGGVSDENLPMLHDFLSAAEYHGKKIVGNLDHD